MELVIGGAYQCKLEYVLNLTSFKEDDVFDASILSQVFFNNIKNSNSNIINLNGLNSEVSNSNVSMINERYMIDELELHLKMPILNHFHLLIKFFLDHQIDPYPMMNHISLNHKDLFIISDEIGSGIVPLSSSDRTYRETTGRILCSLAKDANRVHRVIAGLGTVIK